ncbi:uncharacterized protein MONBRDRAFT_24514 [Monosiga brevicollis MX1]|uniref:Sulfatase N-terminal domain-containing protein n=1 Tax=Monosiga brevicollis TaxID=81824 RepID=A9UWN2_MONBE|nr:uncharacterized protein MONBRDRAFT_24514 [Monosiga brevicollis MX1]EDQ90073.1 predicted protein [Monosiga brevicollis MX1]|eukprot:XP_001744840.1 hypothetical protein [Monosiga brevicollis MX1]
MEISLSLFLLSLFLLCLSELYDTVQASTSEACCQRCSADARCSAWTWHTSSLNCSLTAHVNRAPVAGTISAYRNGAACTPVPPIPAPSPNVSLPNIVLILTDDQDVLLGGWTPMHKAQRLLAEQGTTVTDWMVHTPVWSKFPTCQSCVLPINLLPATPTLSRLVNFLIPTTSQTLHPFAALGSGNRLEMTQAVCMPTRQAVDRSTAGCLRLTYATKATMLAYLGAITFNNGTYANYSTSVIGNVSLQWIESKARANQPFMAYIAPKAPHIQDGPGWPKPIPAPWYANAFAQVSAPRPPNFNVSAPDHHWLVASQAPMTAEEVSDTKSTTFASSLYSAQSIGRLSGLVCVQQEVNMDELYRDRWRSLLSVDDLVESLVNTLAATNQLDRTYILYTSDHGYRFGQFRMPMGKWGLYENDVRIPFVARGPGIPANASRAFLSSNVDVMPTILGLAGVPTPASMDGRSVVDMLVTNRTAALNGSGAPAPREQQLIEYNGLGTVVRYNHTVDAYNNTFRGLRVRNDTVDLIYAEFTDLTVDYNFTGTPEFVEVYDLRQDPYQLHNIASSFPLAQLQELHDVLARLFTCQGSSCN